MSVDEQLSAYRARKAKEKEDTKKKNVFNAPFLHLRSNATAVIAKCEKEKDENKEAECPQAGEERVEHISQDGNIETTNQRTISARLRRTFTLPVVLKLLLWLILWGLFIELQFGCVYFILSLFYLVYTSMRTGSRDKSHLSAYSVFNPNFERIDGTFTTEQFEKELRYGAGAVH